MNFKDYIVCSVYNLGDNKLSFEYLDEQDSNWLFFYDEIYHDDCERFENCEYSTHPIISGTEGNRTVLIENFTILDANDNRISDEFKKRSHDDFNRYRDDEITYFTIECAKILSVVNDQLQKLWLLGYRELSHEEICNLIDTQKLSLGDENGWWHEYSDTPRHKEVLEKCQRLSVNSYSLAEPEKPYPKKFNMCTDGQSLYLLCEDKTGNKFECQCWGD